MHVNGRKKKEFDWEERRQELKENLENLLLTQITTK